MMIFEELVQRTITRFLAAYPQGCASMTASDLFQALRLEVPKPERATWDAEYPLTDNFLYDFYGWAASFRENGYLLNSKPENGAKQRWTCYSVLPLDKSEDGADAPVIKEPAR